MTAWPSAVAGPTAGSCFASGAMTPSPRAKDTAKAMSAKTTQRSLHDQLPSIIKPMPASSTSSDIGVKSRSPMSPARPAN